MRTSSSIISLGKFTSRTARDIPVRPGAPGKLDGPVNKRRDTFPARGHTKTVSLRRGEWKSENGVDPAAADRPMGGIAAHHRTCVENAGALIRTEKKESPMHCSDTRREERNAPKRRDNNKRSRVFQRWRQEEPASEMGGDPGERAQRRPKNVSNSLKLSAGRDGRCESQLACLESLGVVIAPVVVLLGFVSRVNIGFACVCRPDASHFAARLPKSYDAPLYYSATHFHSDAANYSTAKKLFRPLPSSPPLLFCCCFFT